MRILFIILSFVLYIQSFSQVKNALPVTRIVVDVSGKGTFRSIQAALNSLPERADAPRIIFIRNGIYREKIYLEKANVVLFGESRGKTIITQAIARDAWRCGHADDWGVATVNVDSDDVTLENLTIINSFGFDWKKDTVINCPSDSTQRKMLTRNSHQMALRTLNGNRLRAVNCHFKAYGGDTVSPWNAREGMFYFKDCIMEGGVDFYCPRGWAWAENCTFISHSGTAAIWHDGSRHPNSKTVLKNCRFQGFDGFQLGRYHRDAQFYLIGCTFPANMADKDIYLVPTENAIQWGRRVYYANTHRTGGDYSWHRDNLHTAPGAPSAEAITVDWLFSGKWRPQQSVHYNFVPKASAGLRKLLPGQTTYGSALTNEVMPTNHPANDFTKQAIPYYQTEGPAWENDKVGFRLYLDVRNAKDIFGKTTANMVLDTVGTFGDKYYHHYDPRWGMDILKVGTSLGAGALALQLKNNGRDTLVRLGGQGVGKTTYELVKNGPDEAVIRLTYNDWIVLGRKYDLIEEISIAAGNYYYESKVMILGLKGDEKLVTGIVNLKSKQSYTMQSNGIHIIFTHDEQSENNDYLGMAIMVPQSSRPFFGSTPKEGKGITNTFTVVLPIRNNEPISFRFYGCWQGTNDQFKSRDYFRQFLSQEALRWNNAAKQKTIQKTLAQQL